MRVGLTASTVAHASVIVLMLVSFTGAKPFDSEPESMPVDVISSSDFTKLTKGAKTGQKETPPKQLAEKVDKETPVDDPKQKVSEKAPVEATTPPPPPPQAQEQKPQPTPPKAAEQAPPKEQPKEAEALKSEPKQQEQPKEEQKLAAAPMPPKKPPPPREHPKPVETASTKNFNADEIKQLLDKRDPQRRVASASELATTASLGSPRGDANKLSQSEIDAFRARLRQCWNTQGLPPDEDLFVLINVTLNQDGTVNGQPEVMGGKASPYWRPLADSAMRALLRCQPYTMLRPEKYKLWQNMELKFTPKMFDG